jgi:short chain dehydrogenase
MVSLTTIQTSNTLISSTLPSHLVAIFVGATSGIGAITLKKFSQYTVEPRIYIIGRSQTAASSIITELKTLNPGGSYTFIQADVSLIRIVDSVCAQIKEKEKSINLLFMSQGVASFDRRGTPLSPPPPNSSFTQPLNVPRNFREAPPPSSTKLLLPHPLHHFPSPSHPALPPPPTHHQRRRRNTGGPSRLYRFFRSSCPPARSSGPSHFTSNARSRSRV